MIRRAIFLASVVLVLAPSPIVSAFHLALARSNPAQGQKLTMPPVRLQLWFSETPAAGVSQIRLTRDAAAVPLGKTAIVAKDKSMYADPVKPLESGTYSLTWKTAGDDGHALSGEIKFSIAAK